MRFKLAGRRLGAGIVVSVAILSANIAQAQVTGSGTTGKIPKFTAPTVIGDSIITESSGKIGIGTSTPAYTLTVLGSLGIVIDGENSSTAVAAYGVQGKITSTTPGAASAGVRGINNGTGTDGYGVYGSQGGSGYGVFGFAPSGRGVYGKSTSGYGVFGQTTNGTGVYGYSSTSYGVFGIHAGTSGTTPGVEGDNNSTTAYANGVVGTITSTSPGLGSAGVRGINNGSGLSGSGVYGSHAGNGAGVLGTSAAGNGLQGSGAVGVSAIGTIGGVSGTGDSYGVYGSGETTGVFGSGTTYGVHGIGTTYGVYGSGADYGIYGTSPSGGLAAYFDGNVTVTGTLSKGAGSFQIDYPLDPANKTLSHSFVESPDMMNIYNGNVTTDAKGNATVTMPAYFSALNRDFRYQLTVIGQFAQAIVASKIRNNRFVIKTDKPNVEVSWQVTGVRQDAYAKAHRIPTVQDKGTQRGYYLFPAGFGQPKEKSMTHAPHLVLKTAASEQAVNRLAAAKR